MKPENFNKKQAQSVAQVRTLIKSKLAWLSGFPTTLNGQLVWKHGSGGFIHDQQTVVDAQTISKAKRTANTLLRDYPVALPAMVGDAKRWHQRCVTYLEFTKRLLKSDDHNHIPSLFQWDESYAKEQRRNLVGIDAQARLLAQLSWRHFLDRTNIKTCVQCLKQTVISPDSKTDQWHDLINLYTLDKIQIHGLIALTNQVLKTQPLTQVREQYFAAHLKLKNAKSIKKHWHDFNPKPIPKSKDLVALIDFLSALNRLKSAHRRRCLKLLTALQLHTIIQDWNAWWHQVMMPYEKIINHINKGHVELTTQVLNLRNEISQTLQDQPVKLDLKRTLTALIPCAKSAVLSVQMTSCFEALNSRSDAKAQKHEWLIYWHKILKDIKPKPTHFKIWLCGLAQCLKTDGCVPKPWAKPHTSGWPWLESLILSVRRVENISMFFDVIKQVMGRQPQALDHQAMQGILNCVNGGLSPQRIIELLPLMNDGIPEQVIQVARLLNLNNAEVKTVLDLCQSLPGMNESAELTATVDACKAANQLALCKRLLLHSQQKQTIDCLQWIHSINLISRNQSIRLPEHRPVFADWILEYPKDFHDKLATLNGMNSNLQSKISATFKSTWWPKHMILDEINRFEKHLSDNPDPTKAQLNRLKKLKQNLDNHQDISIHQHQKIDHKLDALISRIEIQSWREQLQLHFTDTWAKLFQLPTRHLPEWLLTPKMINKLLPIIWFPKPSKNLAIKIIQACAHNQSDSLPFASANQEFMSQMARLEMDLSAWPYQYQAHTYTAENKEKITLAIEQDPIEILDMGGHFGTCLSPGSFNYFSVFTNIADINKQVIYARDEQGRVVGRVLIGITNQGGLQVFYRYTHHKKYRFKSEVLTYLNAICRQTGLTITNRGAVTPLCCPEWYDDGPNQIPHQYPALEDGSRFRKSIHTLSSADLIPRLNQALKPHAINALVYPTILNIPELRQSRTLFPALLKLSNNIKGLPVSDLLTLYDVADGLGLAVDCYLSHHKTILNQLLYQATKQYWFPSHYTERIAEHHPSDALKVVKAHAKAEKLNWKTDHIPAIKLTAHIALKKLGRHHRAARFLSSDKNGGL